MARSRSTTRATIQNLSGQPGSLAVATSGNGNATLINNAGGVVTGIVSMTGSGSNNFGNAGIWNTLGTSTFGYSNVTNGGTINIFGPTTFSGLTSLTTSGTLNLAAGGTVGTLTIPGNLTLQSGALYVVALAPPTSSAINVGGTASLAGTVQGAGCRAPMPRGTPSRSCTRAAGSAAPRSVVSAIRVLAGPSLIRQTMCC